MLRVIIMETDLNQLLFDAIDNELAEEIIELALNQGADINFKDKDGDTPLLYATQSRKDLAAKLLINRGANINEVNDLGLNALMYATNSDSYDLVLLLLSKGANVNFKDKNGNTALTFAVRSNNVRMVKLLIDKTDKSIVDSYLPDAFNTALYDNQNAEILSILISHGVKTDLENAFIYAVLNNEEEIVNLLLNKVDFAKIGKFSLYNIALILGYEDIASIIRFMKGV